MSIWTTGVARLEVYIQYFFWSLFKFVQKHLSIIQIYDGCYTTKGCFGLSSSNPTKVGEREEMIAHQVFQSCVITRDCDMVVTYQKNSTGQFRFELGGIIKSGVEYVALGISDINKMPGASVMACSR